MNIHDIPYLYLFRDTNTQLIKNFFSFGILYLKLWFGSESETQMWHVEFIEEFKKELKEVYLFCIDLCKQTIRQSNSGKTISANTCSDHEMKFQG